MAIVDVGGVPEIAAGARRFRNYGEAAPATRLFEKTGTQRQADLVKLVARLHEPALRID